jgi:hypothetical protein
MNPTAQATACRREPEIEPRGDPQEGLPRAAAPQQTSEIRHTLAVMSESFPKTSALPHRGCIVR